MYFRHCEVCKRVDEERTGEITYLPVLTTQEEVDLSYKDPHILAVKIDLDGFIMEESKIELKNLFKPYKTAYQCNDCKFINTD